MAGHKKELLLVGGHVASGKTWYCQKLAQGEGTVFVQYDSFLNCTRQKYGIQTPNAWWALDNEAKKAIVSESWQAALESVKDAFLQPEIKRVVLENPFRLVARAQDAIAIATEMDAEITLQMLFRPNIRQNLETAFKRDGLDNQVTALTYIGEIAGYERDASVAFHEYAEMGMHVQLYENRFEDRLKLVAEGCQGSLHVYDLKAYAAFSVKRYLNPNTDFHLSVTNGNTISIGSQSPFSIPPDATYAERVMIQREQAHFRQILSDLPN